MDRSELIAALRDLDAELAEPVDIVIVGGAAMILHFGAARATRDVDVVAVQGNVTAYRNAVKAVAEARGLPADWVSDAAKGFASVLPEDYRTRIEPLELGTTHLHLFVLGRPEQAALKIIALREQDLEDLDLLLPQLTDLDRRTLVAIMNHVAGFRPDWAQRIRYFLEELGWPT
jgi:hypothetical protein